MADAESVNSLVRQCGEVDIIVNNAASFPSALTVDQDMATFGRMFDANVRGAYFLVAGLVPAMMRRGRGSIVNVTTMAAFKGIPRRVRLQRLQGGMRVTTPLAGALTLA
jgi:NAD(P)-dependent dehydrogenase (short-subunit alcohol dehydrogenase family)